jgi:hypothetical protein
MNDYERRLLELPLKQAMWIMRKIDVQTKDIDWKNKDTQEAFQDMQNFLKRMNYIPESKDYPTKP